MIDRDAELAELDDLDDDDLDEAAWHRARWLADAEDEAAGLGGEGNPA